MIYTLTLNPAMDKTILVDELEFNGVNRPMGTYCDSGGKGFNVSRALARLGVGSCALGFVGGAVGEFIQTDLHNQGIETEFIWATEETRTNLVIRERSGRYIKINEPGTYIGEELSAKLFNLIDVKAKCGDIWALCGSLPPGLPSDFYKIVIEHLHKNGVFTALDTSGDALRFGLQAKPDLIKPNQFEAWEVLGNGIAIEEIPNSFHHQGISKVVLSLGEDGLIISDGFQKFWIKSPRLTALNPVGAGDSSLAGTLYGLSSGFDIAETAKWAAASGAAAAMSSSNCFVTKAEVSQIFNQLTVKEI